MGDLKECKEAFEAWARDNDQFVTLQGAAPKGMPWIYFDDEAGDAWEVWQAAWNRRAVPQANAEKDALRWRTFEKALHSRLQGPAHGKKIKVVEVCPMYGDEKEVSNITVLIDAAIRAASKTTPSSGEGGNG